MEGYTNEVEIRERERERESEKRIIKIAASMLHLYRLVFG